MLTGTSAADLTARLNVFARQQTAEAIKLRSEAAGFRARGKQRADAWRGPTADIQGRNEIARAEAAAADLEVKATRCEERAAVANRDGLLLYRPEDVRDLMTSRETNGLYTMCRQAGIVVYDQIQPGSQDYTRQTDDAIKATY